MSGLIPFNRRNTGLARTGSSFDDFYNMLDDFFSDNMLSGRSLMKDTFKIDIEETDSEYSIEAELPGVKKEEIEMGVEHDNLCITVRRNEEVNKDGKNFIHRERRYGSMSRSIRLANVNTGEIKAKLEEGVLCITVPKETQTTTNRKIEIE